MCRRPPLRHLYFEDNDISASKYTRSRRKDHRRLLAQVAAVPQCRIMVAHIDRLYRQPRELELIDLADAGKIEVRIVPFGQCRGLFAPTVVPARPPPLPHPVPSDFAPGSARFTPSPNSVPRRPCHGTPLPFAAFGHLHRRPLSVSAALRWRIVAP